MEWFTQKIKDNYKAWINVALINIPLSISLAVASWATPSQWIITAIWSWIFAFFFASSNYNVFWVAWALASILMTFVLSTTNWAQLLPFIAIFAWLFMLVIYFFKITKYITLIPSTVLHWFLISVWITIALGQISGALWLNNPVLQIPQHKEIIYNMWEIIKNIWKTDIISFLVFLWWLCFLLLNKLFFKKIPWVIILTIIWIIIWIFSSKWVFPDLVLLIDKYPSIKFSLAQNSFSSIYLLKDFNVLINIIKVSIMVWLIAIIETIISAKIAWNITKTKFKKNKEVLWLALANIWSWIFWGLPNTAVFIRTALNIN